MLDQLESAPAQTTSATITCEICQTAQTPPDNDAEIWRCRLCGQEYRGGSPDAPPSIILSQRQLAALRNNAGRDVSGKATIVTNWWTKNDQPTGENFLAWNKDMPARQHTRKLILDWAASGQIKTILEVAFGGLHEYRALREPLAAHNITYSGVDWTQHFVEHAQREFPDNRWTQGDIVRGVNVEPADLVYSQHMLEHVPSLEPAFSNMLRLANKKLINIFFIPPKPFANYDVVNWQKYPLYHNTYGIGHVEAVCKAMGFSHKWFPFGEDVVLLAERV